MYLIKRVYLLNATILKYLTLSQPSNLKAPHHVTRICTSKRRFLTPYTNIKTLLVKQKDFFTENVHDVFDAVKNIALTDKPEKLSYI